MLLLTLKVFSLTGGIEKVSRVLAKSLHDYSLKMNKDKGITVISLCDKTSQIDHRYCAEGTFKGYGGNKIWFGINAILEGLKKETIILSHINLLAIAFLIKLFAKNRRFILLAHGIEVWRDLRPWKKNFIKNNVEVWAVSQYTADILTKKHQIMATNVSVLNNCLDPYFKVPNSLKRPPYLLERHQISPTQPVILTVSRLSSHEMYKGYDQVIECCKNLVQKTPDLKYLLAGKADERERIRLEKLIKSSKLGKNVFLVDFISDEELADYFLLADLFVMPSKKEGFGLVFIEAAACGCTVVAGNQDGSTDALLGGQLGSLVNPDDLQDIESSIYRILSQKKEFGNKEKTQLKCIKYFNYNRYSDQIVKLLNNRISYN